MHDKQGAERAVPLLGLAALVAASLGYYLWLEPLRTFRPGIADPPRPPLETRLPARLWQDPIDEARRSMAAAKDKETPQGQMDSTGFRTGDLLLVVEVYGGYSQLDHETRLRTRYAVGLALHQAGLLPAGGDAEFLRFRAVDWPHDGTTPSNSRKPIPFEWWKAAGGSQRVLVLWVGDDLAGTPHPRSLRTLIQLIVQEMPGTEVVPVLGPTSSNGLEEIQSVEAQDAAGLQFYSPWATADEAFFGEKPVADWPVPIHRSIGSDRLAAGKLLDELAVRGIRLQEGGDGIAVIAEWDTAYGRALPRTFAACLLLKQKQPARDCAHTAPEAAAAFRRQLDELEQNPGTWPAGLKQVIYLRGLDGIGPRAPQKQDGAEVRSRQSSGEKMVELERPDGSSQLDYLRRLADEIQARLGGRLRAVGVLGSDIYDKLLLLQALNARLPGVWFFTTDLDASYLHASQQPWTRNLLIGSAYPLRLETLKDPPKLSPPFRDCYGPAVFRSTLEALAATVPGAARQLSMLSNGRTAVYEIGRTAAYRMPEGSQSAEGTPLALGHLWGWALYFAALVPTLRFLVAGNIGPRIWLISGGVLALALLVYAMSLSAEPLTWLEGVSIWPSVLCRATAGVLAVVLLIRSVSALRKSERLIHHDLPLEAPGTLPAPRSSAWWARLRELAAEDWSTAGSSLHTLWSRYLEWDRLSYRWLRAGSLSLVTTGPLCVAHWLERAPRPCRSSSCVVDEAVTLLSLAVQILLIFFVMDVTVSCTRWIRALREIATVESEVAPYRQCVREIELIARRSQVVSSLILYPFFVLPLMILAQFSFFDRWVWPLSLLGIFGLLLVLALAAAMILRRYAETARRRTLEELYAQCTFGRPEDCEQVKKAIETVERESRGAFSPLSQNPVLAAVLLPVSGAGTGLAIDSMLRSL